MAMYNDEVRSTIMSSISPNPFYDDAARSTRELQSTLIEKSKEFKDTKPVARVKSIGPVENVASLPSTNETDSASCPVPDCSAPFLPEHLTSQDILYSPKIPRDLYNFILSECKEMRACILKQKENKFKIQASFQPTIQSGLSQIEIAFYVYTVIIEEIELSVMHLQRRSGDLFEYHKIYTAFKNISIPSSSEEFDAQQEKRTKLKMNEYKNSQISLSFSHRSQNGKS